MSEVKGKAHGHWVRRFIHMLMSLVPVVYFAWGQILASWFGITRAALMILVIIVIAVLEGIRLSRGMLVFGQRDYEKRQVSAFAWGGISIGLVCLFAPGADTAIPIVFTCAFSDPLMGEMRRHDCHGVWVAAVGVLSAVVIWSLGVLFLGTAWLWVCICPLLAVAAEYPRLRWVDDNALMMLIPLLAVSFI